MSDMTDIVIRSDDATPIDRRLIPVSNRDSQMMWRGDVDGTPIDGQITLTANWEKLKTGTFRLTAKLEIPVMESVSSSSASGYVAAPKVAHVLVGIVTVFASNRSTIADRANIVKMLAHVLCGANSTAGGGTNPQVTTGDVWKNLTGVAQIPYGMIHLVTPT